ncbi:heat stress transcription factor B-4d-like [Nymphaea colorata]|nr:heat stress transcription factor B-4d-like [Nymphaea colorata]
MGVLVSSCEGMLVTMESNQTVPAPFLIKTYQLVDDNSTDDIVSWGEDGSTFVVWRPPEFARDLLPNYFKHNNFSSFVRQLNTYRFRKIVPDRWEFANEFFRKGKKHLLCEIHRRKAAQLSGHRHDHHPHMIHEHPNSPAPYPWIRLSSDGQANWWDSPSPSPRDTSVPKGNTDLLSSLTEDNQRLRKTNSLLLAELSHMRKLYKDIIYFVQNHVKPASPPNLPAYPPLPLHHQRLIEFRLSPEGTTRNNSLTSTNSLTIEEEAEDDVKLFGVPLHGKKRTHSAATG